MTDSPGAADEAASARRAPAALDRSHHEYVPALPAADDGGATPAEPVVASGADADVRAALVAKPTRARWADAYAVFTAITVPLFGTLYLLTAPAGPWVAVAVAHAVLIAVFAALELRLRRSGVRLTPTILEERSWLRSAVSTPAEQVAGVLLLDIYRGLTDGTHRQLFLIDADGRTLLRMRGQLWSKADLAAVAAYYAVPITDPGRPMTWKSVRRSKFAVNLERWERRPRLVATVLGVVGVIVVVPVLAIATQLVAS